MISHTTRRPFYELVLAATLAPVALAGVARAQNLPLGAGPAGPEAPGVPTAAPSPEEPVSPSAPPADVAGKFTPIGYVEASYAYNFNRPSNGITNARGFDNRHNTFSLTNAALGGAWEKGALSGRLVLQVGSTGSTYYLAEPSLAGSGAANATSPELWKYLQEANVGLAVPVGDRTLRLQAGLFLSPIGPETIPVKDNWNYSRSSLFFGLPFYHTGLRATYEATDRWSVTLHAYNGWNSVVDNNDGKSVAASVAYKVDPGVNVQLLYFGGPERARGAAEGPAWRHVFDAFVFVDPHPRFSLGAHADAGFEANRLGTHSWQAGALYARVKALEVLYVAARGDMFRENAPTDAATGATSSPIFWPVEWVSSATGTLDLRPHDNMSVRLEVRHDQAQGTLYYRGAVAGDGSATAPYAANAKSQDTLLLGFVAWL